MRSVSVLLLLRLGLCVSVCGFFTFAAEAKRPNVLFIVVDDLRTALGCYGNKIMSTPNIDNLAKKSVKFERAYVQQAFCGPSRTSFLTGRRPDTTRLYDNFSYWRKHAGNFTTLPQHFKQNGYFTQSVGKVFHPGKASNHSDDYPLSWSVPAFHPPTQQYKQARVCPGKDGKLYKNVVCPVTVSESPGGSLPDIQSSDFAVEFLENRTSQGEQPFFLAVGFHKPHIPLKFPKEYLDLYPMSDIHLAPNPTFPLWLPAVAWNPWTDIRERDDVKALNVSFPFGPVPPSLQLKMRQAYYAATSYMDAQVGKVLAALDKHGFADNTIITFLGDHGWSLGEHQEWSKYSNFDVSTRVPLLFYVPRVTSPVDTPGNNFPFQDVISISNFPKAQSLREYNPHQAAQIKSQMLTRLKGVRRFKRFMDAHYEIMKRNDSLGSPAALSSFPVGGSGRSVLGKPHPQQDLVIVNGGWRRIFQGNVLPFVTRVNTGEKTRAAPKASLNYRLSMHVDKHISLHSHPQREEEASDYPLSTSALVELVDVFPTLAELAGLQVPDTCPPDPFNVLLCTEGSSLVPVIMNVTRTYAASNPEAGILSDPSLNSRSSDLTSWKKAAFSQFPRPDVKPQSNSDKPKLKDIRIMGYSMCTDMYRYTEWIEFDPNSFRGNWSNVYAKELYLHRSDAMEDHNVAYYPEQMQLVETLSETLRNGWRYAFSS
ncbi:iduronate 2-sulfatase-like [Littorina saxatilis]|uniref:Iduronate 2-sulfatase n=1 Tax=Littorina saxatilis TaxID=31220 RepID=A0AAN9B0G3_9CAEN